MEKGGVVGVGGGTGRSERWFDAVTVTVAPFESTTAMSDPSVHCPVALTVNRPPLFWMVVGLTVNDPGCETR